MSNAKITLHDNAGYTLTLEAEGELTEDVVLKVPNKSGSVGGAESPIIQPEILTPASGTTGHTGGVSSSAFSTSDTYKGTQDGVRWEASLNADFSSIEDSYEGTSNLNSWTPSISTPLSTVYIRVRYISDNHISEWAEIINYTTPDVYISTPTLTVEGAPSNVDQTPLLTASAFNVVNGTDTHSSTTWRIVKDIDSSVVWEAVNDTVNKTSIRVPAGNLEVDTNYTFSVQYNGTNYGSSSVASVAGATLTSFIDTGVDGLNTIQAGDTVNGAYFGELTVANLVEDRDYRGPYRATWTFKTNQQVSHNGTLWNALVDVTGVEPGTDPSKWEEDTREGLPTGQWLLDVCGVGYGITDANADGYSATSTSIGALKNNDQGFLKFAKNDKIIYVAKKPFVDTIGWNDLAKRSLVYGDRTVRIGSRLYYVRLIKEDEYTDCLVASTNGTLANLNTTDLALEEKTWVHDETEGATRKTYINADTLGNVDPKSREGSYRPVLELIEEGDEPYNNLVTCPTATSENFQYDFYTDTGYFGVVPGTSLISGNALASSVGITAGTSQHDTTEYWKFYWHGQIKYVPVHTIRHTVSWENIKTAQAVFGVDLGGEGKTSVNIGGIDYNVSLLTGAGKAPADDVEYWNNGDNFSLNVLLEIGRYSQWNELIYRVHETLVDDVLANQDGSTSNLGYTGGVQIGDQWDNFTNADSSIFYTEGGDGTVTWTQETSARDTTHRVHRGRYRLAHLGRTTSTDAPASYGWRPVLTLKANA